MLCVAEIESNCGVSEPFQLGSEDHMKGAIPVPVLSSRSQRKLGLSSSPERRCACGLIKPCRQTDALTNKGACASTSIDHEIVIIIMRGRQTLRTRHSHCCVVKRTCNRAVGKCSDAKPCVDTNQDKHGDSGGEQSDLTHVTLCILGRMQASSIRCAGMLPPSQPLARPNPMGTAATRLAVALDRLEGAKTRLARRA